MTHSTSRQEGLGVRLRPKAIHGDFKFTSMEAVLVAWPGLRAAETKLLIAMPQGFAA
jgi:hypothetical protein